MTDPAAPERKRPVRAYLLGARLDTRHFEGDAALGTTPLTLRVEGGGTAVLFRYGAAVFIDVPPEAEARLLAELESRTTDPVTPRETEQASILLRPGAEEQVDSTGTVLLSEITTERLQIIGTALSKSVVLSFYEARIAGAFDRLEPLADQLARTGRIAPSQRDLARQIGAVLRIQQNMIGRVQIEEEPDVLWVHPQFKRLYGRLVDEFELRERSQAIDRKLLLVQQSVETLLDLVQTEHDVRLEWYVIVLIAIEILINVAEFLWPGLRH